MKKHLLIGVFSLGVSLTPRTYFATFPAKGAPEGMRLLSADEARGLLEKGSWTIVECSKREDLRTPPKTGNIQYVGSGEQGALVIGCELASSARTMTFARSFWSPQQLNDGTILLYRTSVNSAKYDIPSRDADYYIVTRTR